MKLFITPVPLFDREMSVEAYCFRYQSGENLLLFNQSANFLDGAAGSPCLDLLGEVGLDTFTGGLPIFIPIQKIAVLAEVEKQCKEDPGKIIFLLDADIEIEDIYVNALRRMKEAGFRIALENITNYETMEPMLSIADYVFLDSSMPTFLKTLHEIQRKFKNLDIIAKNVYTDKDFMNIKYETVTYFEGRFYSLPVSKGQNNVEAIKVNAIQLINMVGNEDFEMDKIAKIVMQDTALSISLLRLVNSPYLGLTQQVKSINHATALLGQKEIRKWVTTAVTQSMASDRPSAITKLSLTRAKFAENLATRFEMGIHAPSLFLMGLFSMVDVILGVTMQEALNIVKVTDNIRNALVNRSGDFYKVLELIIAYEKADWQTVTYLLILNKISVEDLFKAYIDTEKWFSAFIMSTDMPM